MALGLDIEVLRPAGLDARARRAPTSTPSPTSQPPSPRAADRADARRVPRLARGRGRRGARARPRLDRGPHRRRAGDDRARGQGAGVGRRRRARAGRGVLPRALGHPHARCATTAWAHAAATDKGWLAGLADPALRPARRPRRPARASPGAAHDRLGRPRHRAPSASAEAGGDHGIVEERRLAYVAVTRARTDLLLTAHVWGTASTPRGHLALPRRGAGVPGWSRPAGPWVDLPPRRRPEAAEPAAPPRRSASPWPTLDHRERRGRAAGPARAVGRPRMADARPATGSQGLAPGAAGPRDDEIRMLLDERARRRQRSAGRRRRCRRTCRPRRWSSLAEDAERFTLDLRRPMPTPPALAARRGTAFHAWVEEHYSRAAFVDVHDLPGSADDGRRPTPTSARAAGALPGQRVGRPHAGRGRDQRRDRRRRHRGARPDRRGLRGGRARRRAGWVVVDWKTGARPPGPGPRPAALQLRPTGWPGPGCAGCPSARVRGGVLPRGHGRDGLARACPGADEITRVLRAARPA